MDSSTPIINKVAESGILTIDLADWVKQEDIALIDLADFLFEGIVLREKEFRAKLSETDWTAYAGKWVGIYCSTDAIIQKWAWMLMVKSLHPYTANVLFAGPDTIKEAVLLEKINTMDASHYADMRIVIKGCGEKFVTENAYLAISRKLIPEVKTLMYGEPCSTVPVYKKK